VFEKVGRGEWIRTTDLLVPNQQISMTYEHPSLKTQDLHVFDLDHDWTLNGEPVANPAAVGPWLDPDFHVVIDMLSRTRAVASPSQNLTKICCSHGISRSPYRSTFQKAAYLSGSPTVATTDGCLSVRARTTHKNDGQSN